MTKLENGKISRTNRLHFVYFHLTTRSTLGVYDSHLPLARYMWLFLLFWAQCAHAQLNPFYHPFYPNVTHVRKDTRLSPLFRTANDGKLGGAWEQGYLSLSWQIKNKKLKLSRLSPKKFVIAFLLYNMHHKLPKVRPPPFLCTTLRKKWWGVCFELQWFIVYDQH